MDHLNRRKAIRKRCLDCTGGSYIEVTDCTFTDCPLYPFRSGQGKQNAKARSKSIRDYCLWCMADQLGEVWNCSSCTCTLWTYRKARMEKASEHNPLPITRHIEAH